MKRNGPNIKLLKTVMLNTGKSEPTLISPEQDQARGPFRGDVKAVKVEGDIAGSPWSSKEASQ